MSLGILAAALVLCVVLSAFFSATETAYSALNKVRLKTMAADGDRRAALSLKLCEDYDRLLTTILIGNNIVNIAGASIATVLFTAALGSGIGPTVSTVVLTLVILVFGEVSPKTLAKESPEAIAMFAAKPIQAVAVLFKPLNAMFALWRRLLSRVFKPKDVSTQIEDELMTMVDEAQQEGGMDAHEGELIRSAIEFNDMDAIDILTPRVDVTALEDTASMNEAAAVFRESGYSRIPVFHEDMDHVVGILHEKDFYIRQFEGCTDITQIMSSPVYAPATLKISKLLKLFQESKTHMVVLLDEFGGTEGLVTMEDVLEELVGEIWDEHDDVENPVTLLGNGTWQVEGSMHLGELLDSFDVEDTFDADTVGGLAAEVLGCIPSTGDSFDVGPLHFTVMHMEKRRVVQLHIERTDLDGMAAVAP